MFILSVMSMTGPMLRTYNTRITVNQQSDTPRMPLDLRGRPSWVSSFTQPVLRSCLYVAFSVEAVGIPQVQIHSEWPPKEGIGVSPTCWRIEARKELVSGCVRAYDLFINKHGNWAYSEDIQQQN